MDTLCNHIKQDVRLDSKINETYTIMSVIPLKNVNDYIDGLTDLLESMVELGVKVSPQNVINSMREHAGVLK